MSNKQNSNSNLKSHINHLIERQNDWNNGSRKMSKQELYNVLAGCLELAESVKANRSYSDLAEELDSRGLSYNASTSIATRVIRCVFNTDEQNLSAFSSVITIALRESVKSFDFITWVNQHGGIDKIRRKFAKHKKSTLSVSDLQHIAKNNLHSAPALAVISKANLQNYKEPNNDGLVLNISRINPNGDCEVIATTSDSTALRSALISWGQYVEQHKITSGRENSIRNSIKALSAAVAG